MSSKLEITLASTSPRRRELLSLTGWGYSLCASPVPEAPFPDESPRDLARRLACLKAMAASEHCEEAEMILAADTMVIHAGEVLGKPADAEEAATMLKALCGVEHEVVTALAIQQRDKPIFLELCESRVPMRAYTEDEIQAYVRGGSPLDKAGAYGIQDPDFHPVEADRFRECYANVMGLPLCHLARAMRQLGHEAPEDIPHRCMQFTGYDCTIYPMILRGDL